MKKPKLIIGTINSQPLGMKHERFEELYQYSYKPFLKLLNANPDVYAVLYYSGILLEQLEEHHPEYIMLLQDLLRRKQIEIVGGAYYEPLLPLIPNTDKLGQIELLTTYIRRRFGTRVRGCWVPFGVWDHILPFTLKNSGMEYAFLDTGSREDGYDGLAPTITEEYGKSLVIYPVFSRFLEKVADTPPEKMLQDILKEAAGCVENVVSLLFRGNQPFTDKATFQEKDRWFQDFFSAVRANRDKVEFTLPGVHVKSGEHIHKKYYSPTQYGELMRWRGKPYSEDQSVFKKSLLEFPESNVIYAKMMYVYQLVNQIRGDRSRKKTAREELWKGQGNSVFWYARDGGVYRGGYRKAVFAALLEAEKITRERGIFKSSIVTADIDLDGQDEYLYQGTQLNVYVTRRGGQIFEMDYLPCSWNYLDTFAARNDEGKSIPYLRRAFIDHLIRKENTFQEFESNNYEEMLPGTNSTYTLMEFDRDHLMLEFQPSSPMTGICAGTEMRKQFTFKRASVAVQYSFQSRSNMDESPVFASEINLSLPEPPGDKVRVFAVVKGQRKELTEEKVEVKQVSDLVVEDAVNRVSITLSAGKKFRLWMFPIYTTCATENGELREYQSTCFVPAWTGPFDPEKPWDVTLNLRLDKLTKQKG